MFSVINPPLLPNGHLLDPSHSFCLSLHPQVKELIEEERQFSALPAGHVCVTWRRMDGWMDGWVFCVQGPFCPRETQIYYNFFIPPGDPRFPAPG